MRLLIYLGIILLTACSTNRKKPLTFISPSTISFHKSETKLTEKLKLNDNIVYLEKDSFIIFQDYENINPKLRHFYQEKIHQYYFLNTNKNLIDYVTLEYYQGELVKINLITKGQTRIDSLSKSLEAFFNKPFKIHNEVKQSSSFSKDKLFIDKYIYPESMEAAFTIINLKVKTPSFCGYKNPWWYYLTFWNW